MWWNDVYTKKREWNPYSQRDRHLSILEWFILVGLLSVYIGFFLLISFISR